MGVEDLRQYEGKRVVIEKTGEAPLMFDVVTAIFLSDLHIVTGYDDTYVGSLRGKEQGRKNASPTIVHVYSSTWIREENSRQS